jgi:hypothetical protein
VTHTRVTLWKWRFSRQAGRDDHQPPREGGLLDELKLWVHPVIVGRGTLLFRPGEQTDLRLAATDTTSTGVVILTYHPIT